MLKKGLVDIESIYSLFGLRCTMLWYKFEALIDGLATLSSFGGSSNMYENFEYLANEVTKMNAKLGHPIPVALIHPTSTRYKHLTQ
jgi:hypothetical protein